MSADQVEANKAVVRAWVAGGRPASMISDDFRWTRLANGPQGHFRVHEGAEGLADLLATGKGRYRDGVARNTHFLIGDGEWVAWQVDSTATLLNGDDYHNDYIFTFRVIDGKIAEVYQVSDAQAAGYSQAAPIEVPKVLSDEDAARLNPDQGASQPGYFDPHPPRY